MDEGAGLQLFPGLKTRRVLSRGTVGVYESLIETDVCRSDDFLYFEVRRCAYSQLPLA